eukprot:symbB.v1.2.028337.t1/scaffold2997.1/size65663/1
MLKTTYLQWRHWRTVSVATSSIIGVAASIAFKQAWDLRSQWKSVRMRAAACLGPTEGLEGPKQLPSGCSGTWANRQDTQQRPILLLFLGDSLVSGVGAQASGAPVPAALPRNVAAHLADRLGEIRWAAVGITGADVEKLTAVGLPRLREKVEQVKEFQTQPVSAFAKEVKVADLDWEDMNKMSKESSQANKVAPEVIVVLVAGVNDFRRFRLGYRLRLRRLVNDLRNLVGEVRAVYLPALEIADAPMLQRYPLKLFLMPLCRLWEREKRKAIGWCENAQVLPFPLPPPGVQKEAFFSADLMHPNEVGYDWWARSLAEQIHQELRQRHDGHSRNQRHKMELGTFTAFDGLDLPMS